MRIVIGNAKFFKGCLSCLNVVGTEANFKVSADGLSTRFLDPSHVAMVDFLFPKQSMDEFNYDGEELFNLNLDELLKPNGVLRDLKKETSIDLRLEKRQVSFPELSPIEVSRASDDFPELPSAEEVKVDRNGFPELPSLPEKTREKYKSDFLSIALRDRFVRQHRIPLLDANIEDAPAPKLRNDVRFTIIVDDLKRIIDNAKEVADWVSISVEPHVVEFSTKGDERELKVPLDRGSESLLSLETRSDKVKANFSLNYLEPMVKASKNIADVATLEFSTNMPLTLIPELGNGATLKYYLAPRIEA